MPLPTTGAEVVFDDVVREVAEVVVLVLVAVVDLELELVTAVELDLEVVDVTWLPGRHCEYQSFWKEQTFPDVQQVGPENPFPPHWALRDELVPSQICQHIEAGGSDTHQVAPQDCRSSRGMATADVKTAAAASKSFLEVMAKGGNLRRI